MKIKNIICLILAVVMVASLSACASAAVPSSVDEDGRFIYAVIRAGDDVVAQADDAAKLIRNTLKENFDCNIIITRFIRTENYNHLKSDLAGLILFLYTQIITML